MRDKIALELVKLAKELTEGEGRLAVETPFGRAGGQVKAAMKSIGKKYGWDMASKVFLERDYSGYRAYGSKEAESLPDIDMTGGRTRRDLLADLEKEAKKMERDLEAKLRKYNPESVHVNVSVGRGENARVSIYVKFDEGVPVTPLEFL